MSTPTHTVDYGKRCTYRGYTIQPKLDFDTSAHLINGRYIGLGFVVTNGGIVNVMPGGAWFESEREAQIAIDVLIETRGDAGAFWQKLQEYRVPSEYEMRLRNEAVAELSRLFYDGSLRDTSIEPHIHTILGKLGDTNTPRCPKCTTGGGPCYCGYPQTGCR